MKKTRSTLHPGLHNYPPFYACYILRSYSNGKPNQKTYVGSTPDPPRRIRQHNGQIKGGAKRTKFNRPWEMELVCYNFPSKLIALQFEWALNTPYKSRHLQSIQNNDTGKKKPLFPKSLGNKIEIKLKVLFKMLTCLPWSQYPLKLIFFEENLFNLWQKNLLPQSNKIQVIFKPEGVDGSRILRRGLLYQNQSTIKPIEVDDQEAMLEDYSKIQTLNKRSHQLTCYNCKEKIDIDSHLSYVICQSSTCLMSAHLLCLSKHFLKKSDLSLPRVLPDRGSCPSCDLELRWGDLIKSCYRRMPTLAQLSSSDSSFSSSSSSLNHLNDSITNNKIQRKKQTTNKKKDNNITTTKNKKIIKNKQSIQLKQQQQQQDNNNNNDDDEAEQDFIKMMDELIVSDDEDDE